MHLVLNNFGTSIQRENGVFCIHTQDGKQLIFPDKIKSINISKGAKISSDAVLLAIENEIDVLFIDQTGSPAGRIWSHKYGSVSTIRKNQIEFVHSPQAVEWIKEIIIRKIDNQTALLLGISEKPDDFISQKTDKIIKRLEVYKSKIEAAKAELVHDIAPSLRGWEGAASKSYFEMLSEIMPPKMKFEKRSRQPANDIFNMLLNYGYGMLYGKVEGALIKAGIDPYLGVMHRDDYNRPVLAFDIIEIFRVWIDYVVVKLSIQEVIDEDCYSIQQEGYWLESQGKRILIQSVNDYLEEVIKMNGLERSRAVHIELYAQDLAQKFLKFQ